MKTVFELTFLVVVIAEIAVVAVMVYQLLRNRDRQITVITLGDVLTSGALFSGTAILTTWVARTAQLDADYILLLAGAVGIVSAAISGYLRRPPGRPARYIAAAFLLPLGLGVFAALAGPI